MNGSLKKITPLSYMMMIYSALFMSPFHEGGAVLKKNYNLSLKTCFKNVENRLFFWKNHTKLGISTIWCGLETALY